MTPDLPCPSPEILRRSLDPDDPMPEPERRRIEAHVDQCARSCKEVIGALLRGDTLAAGPEATRPVEAPDAAPPEFPVPSIPGYEVLGELGRGGMGVVYKARQIGLNRLVAVKMILAGSYASPDGRARFRTEAEAVAALQHPNIVQIHEIGECAGAPYITLEYVEGGTLAQKLGGAPQPALQAAETAETLARAVESAHRRGVVHRDLKPANVLLTADGTLKITDFGLAKRLEEEASQTRTGEVVGTPSYMAPEQAAGRPGKVGPACDVYALGAILYELLTGRPPFRGPTGMDTLLQLLHDDPVPPRQLQPKTPRDLETICLKCLEKDPLRRYARAADLADDLQRFQGHEPIAARPAGPWQRAVKWARRRPAVAVLMAVAVVSLIGGTVASTCFAVVANERADQLEKSRKDRAQAQVDALLTASPGALPGILQNLRLDQEQVLPRLRELWDDKTLPERQRPRVALALLPADPGQVDYLYDHLLEAEPDEVGVFVQQLSGHKGELTERLWAVLEQPGKGREDRRLRAAAALAAYDPDSRRWGEAAGPVVGRLVAVDAAFLPAWKEALRPVLERLLGPLAAVFRDRREEHTVERVLATSVLADYAAGSPETLADLLQDADERQFAALFPRVEADPGPAAALLNETVGKKLDAEKTEDDKERLAKRQANAAVALLRLGQPDAVWPLLKHRPDPRVRSYLIHYLSPRGAKAGAAVQRLDEEKDVSIRRTLLLILGEFGPDQLTNEERDRLVPKVLKLYQKDPDAGLHGAADWLLRQWGKGDQLREINRVWAADLLHREERLELIRGRMGLPKRIGRVEGYWYVNGRGQTMVVIPGPMEFLMGSPTKEAGKYDDETQHKERIGRTFALAAKSVTVEQYRQFDKGYELREKYTRTADLPVVLTSWYQAAAYCNWLSKEEGIPEDQWCYEMEDGQVTKLKANYLSRTGYRLPTEAEMEVATRAGALTSWYFGETEDLLPKYARYAKNSQDLTWPVGSLKPNDLGLFDVQGNVWTWCQESYQAYPASKDDGVYEDKEDVLSIDPSKGRVFRGGSFRDLAPDVRSAFRTAFVPVFRNDNVGFRPARTFR